MMKNTQSFPNPSAHAIYQLKRKRAHQKGSELMAIIFVLAIIAFLAIVVLARKDIAFSSNESTNIITDIATIQTTLSQIQLGTGGYGSGSLNTMLIRGKRVPSSLRISGDTIKTKNGAELLVNGAGDYYTVELTNVEPAICQTILPALSSGWQSVQIGGGTTVSNFPVSAVDASNMCAASDRVSIKWTSL